MTNENIQNMKDQNVEGKKELAEKKYNELIIKMQKEKKLFDVQQSSFFEGYEDAKEDIYDLSYEQILELQDDDESAKIKICKKKWKKYSSKVDNSNFDFNLYMQGWFEGINDFYDQKIQPYLHD